MRIKRLFGNFIILAAATGLMLSLNGCFTGVEGTSKINLSKKDIIATAPTEEDILLADIRPANLKDWQQGKEFLVADEKFGLIVENGRGNELKVGDILTFWDAETVFGAGGGERVIIRFKKGDYDYFYAIDRRPEDIMGSFKTTDIPMLIDLDIVESVREKLKGKKMWTKSALWYSDSMLYKKGKKFNEVEISDVLPGNAFFPIKVNFMSVEGEKGSMLMNIGTSGNDSRTLSKLFSLTDPKRNFKNISKENWEAICNETVRLGMTKEECRLSRGNPSDVDMGHNYSNSMEIWFYPDGSYLQFVDGLLVGFK